MAPPPVVISKYRGSGSSPQQDAAAAGLSRKWESNEAFCHPTTEMEVRGLRLQGNTGNQILSSQGRIGNYVSIRTAKHGWKYLTSTNIREESPTLLSLGELDVLQTVFFDWLDSKGEAAGQPLPGLLDECPMT
jgi:hypothetical protein